MTNSILYEAKGICTAWYDSSKSQVGVTWHKFPGDGHFRPCLDAQVRAVEAERAKFVIVDVRKTTGVPTQDDQNYLVQTVFPAYKKANLLAIVTLVPESAVAKMGAKRWQSSGSQFGFKMFEAGSLDDANGLLASEFKKAA